MLRRLALGSLGILLVAVPCRAPAQAPAPQPERRTLAVSVLDKDGKAVHGLTAENFRGEFRGQPIRILSASEDSSPRRIAIIVDTSASMRPNQRIMRAVLEELFLNSNPQHYLSVFTAQETFTLQATVAPDRASREQALRQLERSLGAVRSSTAFYDGVVRIVRDSQPVRIGDTICLVSDGVDNASDTREDAVEKALAVAGVRFFMLSVPSAESRRETRRGRKATRRFAEASGGLFLDLGSSAKSIPKKMPPVQEAIGHLYALEVEVSVEVDKPRDWTLELVDADGKKRKDVEVAYPRLLVPLTDKK